MNTATVGVRRLTFKEQRELESLELRIAEAERGKQKLRKR